MRQGGGMSGMQEMMKAMMGGNVSDEEMAEMQSQFHYLRPTPVSYCIVTQE